MPQRERNLINKLLKYSENEKVMYSNVSFAVL